MGEHSSFKYKVNTMVKNRRIPSAAEKEYKNAYQNFIGYVQATSTETNIKKIQNMKEYAMKYIQYLNSCWDVPAHDVRHHAYALAILFDCSPNDFGKTRLDPIEHPTTCNICGGRVVFISNSKIYNGKEYGSGRCYYCTRCGAFVGTHKPWPDEAMGLLSDGYMRDMRKKCHDAFDEMWKSQGKHKTKARTEAYKILASRMGISPDYCHFGFFDANQLTQAYRILTENN